MQNKPLGCLKGDGWSGLLVKFKNDPHDNLKPSRVLAADDLLFDGPELLVGDVSPPTKGCWGLDLNNEPKRSKCLFLLRVREEELNVNVEDITRDDVGVIDTSNCKKL